MNIIKYPIGIQSFADIIENQYLYVDKTAYIHELVTTGKYYFLSRPRRFGKSLLLSTIESLYKGDKYLFEGLAISELDWNWDITYPVIHIDFNGENFNDENSLHKFLDDLLSKFEIKYKIEKRSKTFGFRFREIIQKAAEINGSKAVVLIDEYDKPILDAIGNVTLRESNRETLQAFYSVLKSMDGFIQFGMLTGVSKFSKVSIFSGLNNLNDISLNTRYNSICGITEEELLSYFSQGIEDIAKNLNESVEEVQSSLKLYYDGYHFSKNGEDVYNPFSLLSAFANKDFSDYWFATGTPTSLIRLIEQSNFPMPEMEHYQCSEDILTGSDIYLSDPIPLLFQSGYLTIKGYDKRFKLYTLGFPNKEVAEGFVNLLYKSFTKGSNKESLVKQFVMDVEQGHARDFMEKLQIFFSGIPYDLLRSAKEDTHRHQHGQLEVHYQNIMYVIFKLMGFHTHAEFKTANGRIDMMIETQRYIYLLEFKINSSAEIALHQIDEKDYSMPFKSDGRTIIKIGANFDTKSRKLTDFIITEN
ncbi:MAG: AAA family ATPase [Bacteroidales bacterium]|nr:AAA family ATPase [Bacteroidales bacterium]